ncbi:MAG: DNA primase DnaG [Candidatus Hodarchaeales archaeon]
MIHIRFTINGIAEKSDVIGAIFGQTEGLLGDSLDLRDLQKTSRVGRIGVKIQYNKQQRKTTGIVVVPSSLDRIETAILAAALETVDRVGPCVAKIDLLKIEDIRKTKRQQIIQRATSILKSWEREVSPESSSLVEEVVKQARVSAITKYGPDQLPAGPGVAEADSVIVVEGRADVINLLRYGFQNTIAVEGTSIPQSLNTITSRKVTTAFLDGDRGGELILKELVQVADIDYVAKAPKGREVEDLTGKEVLKSLRNKVPIEIILRDLDIEQQDGDIAEIGSTSSRKGVSQVLAKISKKRTKTKKKASDKDLIPGPLLELVKQTGSLEAIMVSEKLEIIQNLPIADLRTALTDSDKVHGVIFDGIITQRLLDIASEKKLKFIIGAKIGEVAKKPLDVDVYIASEQFAAK